MLCRGQTVGKTRDGRVLLPNGWYLSPAGKQIPLGGFPLNVVPVPHSNYAVTTSNGYGDHFLAVVDVNTQTIKSRVPIHEGWMGLAVSPDGGTIYASAGDEDRVLVYRLRNGDLILRDSIAFPKGSFPAGLALNKSANVLFAAGNLSNSVISVDLQTARVVFDVPVGHKPYACVFNAATNRIYVTNWGGDTVSALDADTGFLLATIQVEAKPNALLLNRDGRTLFVANGDHNSVSVVDLTVNRVIERIDVSLPGVRLPGTIPNALALSSSGRTLYVADADANAIAVVDVSIAGRSAIAGFIPTGWFPTALTIVPLHAKDMLVVTNAKGAQSYGIGTTLGPNETYSTTSTFPAKLMQGTVSFIPQASSALLLRYTKEVRENSPSVAQRTILPPFPLGKDCPIRHVFYIIKENRTYDQVLGDLPEGNGDPRFTLFGELVTPNEHALARQFTLIDNLYHNAEVSATGHFWTDSAYATEYVEKLWPSTYSGRGGAGRRLEYHDDDDDYPSSGFLWDLCKRQGMTYRSYGEFGRVLGAEPGHVRPATKGLAGHVNPDYLGADAIASFSDLQRYGVWHKEFVEFVGKGTLPSLEVISLPGDHTVATRPGYPTPKAMVAENDFVLGKMIDDISHSLYWKDSAIFVIEDDPQSGPDHVDCHRTTAFVISPYVRRRFVDHQMYSSVSMLLTMEKILGLPPMTQFDAKATPMWSLFQSHADLSPYVKTQPNVDLKEINTQSSYGASESSKMLLDAADEADDGELNEILWKSMRGSDSVMPPRRVGANSFQR